jgi:hypothetical protein
MWEPVGPLPATVYWRRRWVAIASTIVAILLVAWSVTALLTPHAPTEDAPTTLAASRAALSAPQQASPSPAPASTEASTAPTDPPPGQAPTPSQPGAAEAGTPSPDATPPAGSTTPGAPATTSEELRPDETPRQPSPVATPVPVPPTGPVPCTNAMLAVGAEIDSPQHKVGDKPVLRLVITNSSNQPCVRDLDSARQEIVVWSGDGASRLWSSNDCTNASSTDLRTMVPGQPVAFAVTWAGRTSTPGCAQPRTVVPAGAYRVMTRLDDDISAPTPFLLNP